MNPDLEALRMSFPEGARIRLIMMNEDPYPVPSGTGGTVEYVDDAGQVHICWDNGSHLALIPGKDEYEVKDRETSR